MTPKTELLDESGEHLTDDVIIKYVKMKDKFTSDEQNFIDAHLVGCLLCRSKINNQLEPNIENEPIHSNPVSHSFINEHHKGIFKYFNYWKYVVAAFIFVATFLILFYEPDAGKNKNHLIANRIADTTDITLEINLDSLAQKKNQADGRIDEKLIINSPGMPEEFGKNILLENFIQKNNNTSQKIILITPQMEELVSNAITFKWSLNSPSKNLQFTIIDNRNNPVYNATISGTGLTIDKKFKDGLYYWKLESDGNLEAVGKFLVRR